METEVITVRTGSRPAVADLTAEATRFAAGRGDGLLHVFVPHATAGLARHRDRRRHRHGSRGHGRDHVMPARSASRS